MTPEEELQAFITFYVKLSAEAQKLIAVRFSKQFIISLKARGGSVVFTKDAPRGD